MNNFKIIAIRPLVGCPRYILKRLVVNQIYYLSNDYEIISNREIKLRENTNLKPLPSTFFQSEKNKLKPSIDISAIVGKNGDGKSSLIELMIRLLNNFAYMMSKKNFVPHDIQEIEGVRAELYYKIGDQFYCLSEKENEGISISIYSMNGFSVKMDEETQFEIFEILSESFFYTLISNYSLYAYNSDELADNEGSWIDNIFHKNDSYQTPIVLHPMRTEGNIDVNREKYLAMQRLISLFANSPNIKESENSFRKINNQSAELLLLKDSNVSKLQEKTILDYFYRVRNNSLLDMPISNLKSLSQSIKRAIDSQKSIGKLLKELQEHYIIPLKHMRAKMLEKNIKILGAICKASEAYIRNEKKVSLFSNNSDLRQLITELETLLYLLNGNKENFKDHEELIENLIQLISFYGSYKDFNILQIQRIDLVAEIYGLWSGKQLEIDLPDNLKYIFNQGNVSEDIETLKSFNHDVKFDIGDIFYDYNELSYEQKNWHYIIYKTIQIFEKYPRYNDVCYPFNNLAIFFSGEAIPFETYRDICISFIKLNKDKSHVTSKIRICLDLAKDGEENYKEIEKKTLQKLKMSKAEFFELLFPNDSQRYIDNSFLMHLDELKELTKKDNLERLNPPIFQPDIVFHQTTSGDYTLLSSMSSGEKQLLFSTSAIVYHLQNINSVAPNSLDSSFANKHETSRSIKYNNVNLVLEEIELYFHPEYQRRFVKYLLDAINKSTLDNTMSLNIIFVTHSPFILSDIPKQNVLFLKDGMPNYDMQENTFGANIHSLLKNGFFLDTLPIGEFAHNKINELFNKLNSGDFDKAEYEAMYQYILLVGEPFLRGQLLGLYNSYKVKNMTYELESNYLREINNLRKRLEEVESKISNNDK